TERSDVVALVDLFREVEDSRFSHGALRAADLDPGTTQAAARAAAQLERACKTGASPPADTDAALRLALLAGYPDRVARRVRAGGRALALAEGGSAELSESSVVRDAEWLVALDAEEGRAGTRSGAVVRLASAIEPDWLIELFGDDVVERREVTWNAKAERAEARETMSFGSLVLHADESADPPPAEAARVLTDAAMAAGPAAFAPDGAFEKWLARARFAAGVDASVQAPDDDAVRRTLLALCDGLRSFAELREAGLLEALKRSVGRAGDLDRLAPERVTLAGGRAVGIEYAPGKPPSIASRLQDFFGMTDGPRVGGGRVPLVLELLAPNQRAVQVTTDLAGFWQRHYPAIRKELARKYPRHSWPDYPTKPAPRMRPRT
ncbi:MAG: ATP-dependent helicase C-terminal domain-containing protein, partial [Polyangiaceae bacterium]